MPAPAVRKALVTGASAGLGAEFARQLAAGGSRVILVARRKERLDALARDLEGRFGTSIEVLPADLSRNEDIFRVADTIAANPDLDLLVNNAGGGGLGPFATADIASGLAMLQVHVTASVVLSRAALGGMLARGAGSIINVASLAAFAPFALTLYGATKSFLVSFSRNLAYELQGKGIRVQALCPGLVLTELHDVIGVSRSFAPKFMWMEAPPVVRASLKALASGKVVCVPGLGNRLIAAALRCPPTAAVILAAARWRWLRRRLELGR